MPRAKKPKPVVESPALPKSFDRGRLQDVKRHPPQISGLGRWTVEDIMAARSAQAAGSFRSAVALATAMKTEPSIFASILNRLAPHRGLARDIVAPTKLSGTAAAIQAEAKANFCTDTAVGLSPGVIADDFERNAIHAIAIDQLHWLPRADGTRLDAFVSRWPLESTVWVQAEQKLYAQTTEGRTEIVHGDGRWIVHQQHADQPWRWGALLPLAMLWSELAYGRRDRSSSATSHGDDKWIGNLPPDVPMDDPLSDKMLEEMEKLYEAQRVMLLPYGAAVKRDEAMSQAWQIFKDLLESGSKDAQRIMLGQDGTMTNTGGNYVKAWGLFGVRNDIIEADISTIGAGYSTGLLRPWSIVNFGRWDRLEYRWLMPDADEDARRESIAERTDAFNKAVSEYRANGFEITQDFVDELANKYGVLAPKLAGAPAAPPSDVPAPAPSAIVPHREPLRPAA